MTMDDILLEETREFAATLPSADEAGLLLELFAIATDAEFTPPLDDGYTPFVYPH